ncbi:MAG: nitroreductase/quinone reductase family protein [Chloroflexota bacterium]
MAQTTSGAGIPPAINNTIKFILRSPLHGILSKNFLLINFVGRKSGKTFTTPVSYSRDGNYLYVFTHATWWKNLQPTTPITLRLRGKDVQGLPEPVVEDKKAVAAGLMAHLRRSPYDASFYGVTLDKDKNPRPDEVEVGAQTTVMIRIALC